MACRDLSPAVKNILLLNSDGMRVAVKYYSDDWYTNTSKFAFEKLVFNKTKKSNAKSEAETTTLESNIIVYKFVQDLHFFVIGGDNDNELISATVFHRFCCTSPQDDSNEIVAKAATNKLESAAHSTPEQRIFKHWLELLSNSEDDL